MLKVDSANCCLSTCAGDVCYAYENDIAKRIWERGKFGFQLLDVNPCIG